MNREEQLRLINRDLHIARNRLTAMIGADVETVDQLVISRVDNGYDEFGDRGWRKTPYELKADIHEEIADALAYIVFLMRAERMIAQEASGGRNH